ncbi:MAG: hypothetical protein ACM3IJ_05340 [Candidatus Levyibacteriota bacterium]
MRNIREVALSGIITAGVILGGACSDSKPNPIPPSFVGAGTLPEHSPTPLIENIPEYNEYTSPNGFSIEYPSDFRQIGDSFKSSSRSDFVGRFRVIAPGSNQRTPAILDSVYAKGAQILETTPTTVDGLPALKTTSIFPQTFGIPVECITYQISGPGQKKWTLEFAADTRNFPKDFPQERIGTILGSLHIQK